ncbi:MAG: ribulose-phosphate 3-epimerase [Spirochaetota bacterium]
MAYKRMVSPSLLAADFAALGDAALEAEQAGADSLHVDYMDGHYVPNLTFGIDLLPALKKRVRIPLLAHLMIDNAEQRLDDFIRAGADCIVLQEDAVEDAGTLIDRIHQGGARAGLALNPPRPLDGVAGLLPRLDFLLVLSVNPGFGGQSFLPETLEKMKEAHRIRTREGLGFDIGVDGGVNRETAGAIARTGANVLIAGSAVFGRPDLAAAIRELRNA